MSWMNVAHRQTNKGLMHLVNGFSWKMFQKMSITYSHPTNKITTTIDAFEVDKQFSGNNIMSGMNE